MKTSVKLISIIEDRKPESLEIRVVTATVRHGEVGTPDITLFKRCKIKQNRRNVYEELSNAHSSYQSLTYFQLSPDGKKLVLRIG